MRIRAIWMPCFPGTTIDRPVPVYAKEADSGFHELFRMMEDGLFYELGITLPRLVGSPQRQCRMR